MFCMRDHGLELSEYLLSLVHDFVHAEPGQQPRAFVLDVFHDSGAVRKVQEYHFRRGVHCNTEYVIRLFKLFGPEYVHAWGTLRSTRHIPIVSGRGGRGKNLQNA